jgi:dTDP-glucose pyrophosphorylase/predicted transcriptional regulator
LQLNDTKIIQLAELEHLMCEPTCSMHDVLTRINSSDYPFQLVVDSDRRLIGTITDGDVRRAFLTGATMGDPVERIMNGSPKTTAASDLVVAEWRLRVVTSMVPFLPLLDPNGRLAGVLVKQISKDESAAALIMAGGRGSRLGDQTRQVPKPLLTIQGLPMLEHILRHIETAGIRDVFISTHYLSEQIEDFCRSRDGSALLTVLKEETPFGTAGALFLMPDDMNVPVLVMNCDVVSNVDLAAMLALHRYSGCDATIAVVQHEFAFPYGIVRMNEQSGFIGIEEKPRIRHFVAAGIYLVNNSVQRLVPKAQRIDMPELLEKARDCGLKIGVFPIHENWRDVGRPADLEAANINLTP